MLKKLAFDLKLPTGDIRNVVLTTPQLRNMPDFLIDVFNLLTNVTTSLFFVFIFIAHVFSFSVIPEVDFVILIYTYVILVAFFQLAKLVLGGDKFFPKIGYDLFVLLLPPFLILPLIFSDNLNIGMFGTLQTWNTAGITLLSVIIFAYILAINFSYKRGFKNIQFWFEFGLIVAGITRFINPSLVVPDIDFLLVLLIPVFIFRLFNVDSLRLKFTSLILSILGILIAATMSFLNINLADYNWGIEHALFIFNLLLILFGVYSLYKKRKHLKKFLSKVSKGSTIEFSLPKFDYRSISALKNLIVIIFFIGSVYYLINNGFIEDTFDNFIAGFTDTIGKSNIQELFLGKGVSLETNFFLNIMDAFGIVGVGVFLISIGVVLFSEIKKLTKKFEVGRFSFVLAQSIFILTGIFFQLTTLMVFVQFTYISFSMINARTGEFDFEQYQYMSIKGIKDKRVRIFLNILKFLLILIALVGVVAVIASLTSIIGRNLR